MAKTKKLAILTILSLSLIFLTACGLKLDAKVLSSDGGVYLVKDSSKKEKSYWKFKEDGKFDVYDAQGALTDKGMQSTYKVTEHEKSYDIIVSQIVKQSDKDYSVKFTTQMVLNVPKKNQNKDEFTASVTSIKVTDSQIESNDQDIKSALEQHFSKDQLNKQFSQADFSDQKLKFKKQDIDAIRKAQKANRNKSVNKQSSTTSSNVTSTSELSSSQTY